MDKRDRHRTRRRLTCELLVEGERAPAMVRDLSQKGLFVQTRMKPRVNSVVEVIFPPKGLQPEVRVEAGVARKRAVPPRLQASVPGGVGLELLGPRPEFERWVLRTETTGLAKSAYADMTDMTARPGELPTEAPEVGIRAYRIRLTARNRAESRVLTIRCESFAGARARALARMGQGWKIADLQAL
jgi:hypothetical protein